MAWRIEDLQEQLLIGSTLVEGSTLTESEAQAVLAGRTVQGHAVREVRELLNYRHATEWIMQGLKQSPYLSLELVLGYHAQLMHGLGDDPGRFKTHQNYTIRSDGTRFDYQHPSEVKEAMAAWVSHFNLSDEDPVAAGAQQYARFQASHPFADGNGRIGRVLLAYYLHRETGATFRLYARDKLEHLRAIEASDTDNLAPLVAFVRARVTG